MKIKRDDTAEATLKTVQFVGSVKTKFVIIISISPYAIRSRKLLIGICFRHSDKMAATRIITRSLSTSAAAHQMVKPPVQVFGMEGRYATALYSAASKNKVLDVVEKDMIKVQGLAKTDKKFAEFIKDPSIKRKIKADALLKIGQSISLNPASTNLLSLLAENGRLNRLNTVVNAFKILTAATRGEIICEVVSAQPLDAETKSQLQTALNAFLKKGQTILLHTKVDPAIIGGLVVSIGDKYVDMSVASKIKKYTDIIQSAV